MFILSWNCRGAASPSFRVTAKELVRLHRPYIFVIVEPRISGDKARQVIRSLGWPSFFCEDVVGFSGGIWVLWGANYQVSVIQHSTQVVHLLCEQGPVRFLCSMVYAKPIVLGRQSLWAELCLFKSFASVPWVLIGDLNCCMSPSEREGVVQC